jgi:prepilin-type N-terminal cleavage/methylation domain-containing protein
MGQRSFHLQAWRLDRRDSHVSVLSPQSSVLGVWGFTLVEMLVVIGIIGILIAILLPSLNKAQAQAQRVKCMSNMQQIGQAMLIYAESWNGYLFPPGLGWPGNGQPQQIPGSNPPQYDLWPFYVFKDTYPTIMLCPSDVSPDLPSGNHSYLANAYLLPKSMDNPTTNPSATDGQPTTTPTGTNDIKYSTPLPPGHTPSDVIVLGEKKSSVFDYYMDPGDFAPDDSGKVEEYRHGLRVGSNYLMLDMHVETTVPTSNIQNQVNPWSVYQ